VKSGVSRAALQRMSYMADTTTQRQSFGLLRLTLFHPKAKRAIETSNTRIHPKADSGLELDQSTAECRGPRSSRKECKCGQSK